VTAVSLKLNGNAVLTELTADPLYVNTSGDTMTGTLNMGANKITTTATTFALNELVSKSDVNNDLTSLDNAKVNKSGDTMTGILDMGTNEVKSTVVPVNNETLTNKLYVDNQDSLRVLKAGDTMTGNLDLVGAELQQNGVTAYLPLQKTSVANIFCGGGGNSAVGASNSGFGFGALDKVVDGQFNCALGTQALRNLTSGNGNTAMGLFAGSGLLGVDITTEDGNTLLGSNTKGVGFSNSIAIGTTAQTTASNQMMIGSVNSVVSSTSADLGSTTLPFKDLRLSGTAYLPLYQVPNIEQKVYSQLTTLNRVFGQGFEDMVSAAITIPANTLREGTILCFELGGNCIEAKNDEIVLRLQGVTGTTTLYTTPTLECKEDTTGSQGWKLTVWATIRGVGATTLSLLGDWEYTKDNGNKLAGSHFNDDNVSIKCLC
jgi:hypothetical protein